MKKSFNKVDIKPVLIKDEIKIQFTYNYKTKVIHENLSLYESTEKNRETSKKTLGKECFYKRG